MAGDTRHGGLQIENLDIDEKGILLFASLSELVELRSERVCSTLGDH